MGHFTALTYAEMMLLSLVFTLMYCVVATLRSWPV
jgi:hypothetical protein